MFAGKQFDIVMGVDIHIIQPPGPVPPVPVPHPFIGMVYDPFEFIPFIGATTFVNGLPRAQAGTNVIATMPHIPIGGVFVKPPSNDGEIFMGSISVPGEGEPFSFMGCPVLTCHDVGMVSIPRFNRKSKAKPKSLVLPTSILICVPKGGMNILGDGYIISLSIIASLAGSAFYFRDMIKMRWLYEKEVKALKKVAEQMRKAGKSSEKIARILHKMRREIGIKYKKLTKPNELEKIYKRNIEEYGDPLGRTFESYLKEGYTYDDIIKGACKPGGKFLFFKR